jgi:5-methylcytosine-specific restriction protein A
LKDNVYTPATVVDHIKPHKGNRTLFWDPKNHQPMCEHHHNVKTATEDGGYANKRKGTRGR